MRIEKLLRQNSIWYQIHDQKVQNSTLIFFDYTVGTFVARTHSEGFAESATRRSRYVSSRKDISKEYLSDIHTSLFMANNGGGVIMCTCFA